MQVFSKEWFDKYQRQLLWLLNAPIIKIWFRWVMRIRTFDCKLSTKINRIEPNNFTFGGKKIGDKLELTTDFRTHNKYAKRLYYAFKPFWHLIHLFDTKFANEVIPALNMGFDTLTAYPVPGTTVDGWVNGVDAGNATWANLIARTGDNYDDSDATGTLIHIDASVESAKWTMLKRGIFLFTTSSLPDDATIDAAVLSVNGYEKSDGLSVTPDMNVYASTPASNTALANGDFSQLGSTAFATAVGYSSWNDAGYTALTFNSTGRAAISKTGISKFGIRNANYDVAASAPSWSNSESYIRIYYSDQTGTTADPKLVVTYNSILPGAFFQLF